MSVNTDCEDKSNEFYSDDDHMEVDDPNEPRSHPTDNDLPPAYYNILSPEMPTPEHEDDDEFENESEGWSRFDEVLDADAPLSLTEEVTKLEEMIGPEGEAELLAMPLREREGENIQEEKIPEEIKAAKAKATEAAPPRFRKPNNDKLKIRLPAPGPIPPTQFKTLEAFTPLQKKTRKPKPVAKKKATQKASCEATPHTHHIELRNTFPNFEIQAQRRGGSCLGLILNYKCISNSELTGIDRNNGRNLNLCVFNNGGGLGIFAGGNGMTRRVVCACYRKLMGISNSAPFRPPPSSRLPLDCPASLDDMRRLFLQDKIVANAIWRFLELRGFLLNTYRHSPLARAMYAAVKHAKMRFSCRSLPPSSLSLPASCSPPPPLPLPPLLVRSSPFHTLPALPLSPPSLPTQVPLTYTPAQVNDKLQDQCLELPLGIFEGDFDALLPASIHARYMSCTADRRPIYPPVIVQLRVINPPQVFKTRDCLYLCLKYYLKTTILAHVYAVTMRVQVHATRALYFKIHIEALCKSDFSQSFKRCPVLALPAEAMQVRVQARFQDSPTTLIYYLGEFTRQLGVSDPSFPAEARASFNVLGLSSRIFNYASTTTRLPLYSSSSSPLYSHDSGLWYLFILSFFPASGPNCAARAGLQLSNAFTAASARARMLGATQPASHTATIVFDEALCRVMILSPYFGLASARRPRPHGRTQDDGDWGLAALALELCRTQISKDPMQNSQ
ncbi:hypothetical protein C8J57DRAFT_1484742 [Mycena rebaudengoi]|nr:hypothetical protein C8J57DRAFT_1484742 [Mycena rebaudengoi]